MPNQGWRLSGDGPNLAIAEVKQDNDIDITTYLDAREQALTILRDHVQPYLEQIERLESDEFATSGKLPRFKVWQRNFNRQLVIAKTKKRAIELVRESRYGFDQSWALCSGTWWYQYAEDEGVIVEETDDKEKGTGVYLRPLSREESVAIAEAHLEPFRGMPIEKLASQIGQTHEMTAESQHGTPYRVKTVIDESYRRNQVMVEVNVDDRLQWWSGLGQACLHRELPAQESCNWLKEGF
ncbi:hypothetical protein [Rubripirellula reticaptiva]|uniref:Uncharacterized protein n=1 Tax=Rubripirellula reticaptiva TaxID=2528013 RepID=A0A5C6ELI9_9BACT|nr:hypothetical protein [Rubripirellula reticaptiva]TWU49345.1 hypothetical protein Poly59_39590 [Rubripirellula reticaptiva]